MAWTANTAVTAGRAQVMDVLTSPCSIAAWAPVPFEVEGLKGDRLEAGSRARVAGRLAGQELIFEVDVHEAELAAGPSHRSKGDKVPSSGADADHMTLPAISRFQGPPAT